MITPIGLLTWGLAFGVSLVQAVPSTTNSKVLIFATTQDKLSDAATSFQAYGIPFEGLVVPKEGVTLPKLNSTGGVGNYGGFMVVDSVSYEYDGGSWHSAITDAQWTTIYDYQKEFHVRMVRVGDNPSPASGTKQAIADTSCCADGEDQLFSFTNTTGFSTAGLKTNAGVSTSGLYHVPGAIAEPSTTWQIASFGAGGAFKTATVAAVVNNFAGREQMVFFLPLATFWSQTSNFLQHAYVHWVTRGLFLGKRKTHLNMQVDDLQLSTELYYPKGKTFKISTKDLDNHITWMRDINSRLPSGSNIMLELGHNGNGDLIAACALPNAERICDPAEAVDFPGPDTTELEFKKPLGTGVDIYPEGYEQFNWTKTCCQSDNFAAWFTKASNLNAYAHVSHTFSHMELNNATFHDATRDIYFNQAWLKTMGIDKANRFSPKGLIPPAITGMHNGDAIRAWLTNGITAVVGDNTRPVLRNQDSIFWPLTSTVESNGYAGMTIIPRFSTAIYYNCDTPECTSLEWKDTSAGSGEWKDLLKMSRDENTRYLLRLQADPYMFHQANMRQNDLPSMTVGSKTGKLSILMAWAETVLQEMTRLTTWPITSLKHDDVAKYFLDRKTLDDCKPKLSYVYNSAGKAITGVKVETDSSNSCSVPVPVTVPKGSTTSSGSKTSDKVGSEPLIEWVKMSGNAVTLTLSSPVTL